MTVYYNEFDPFAAQWLQNLSEAGYTARGRVDSRSILDVRPEDTREQSHFFAGIGAWSLALRWAGVADTTPVWTGSCPCQPFSAAGRGKGFDDERHLWPIWRDLIAECRPPVVFGEQVASPAGREWLSVVRAEMEDLGYEVGAADLCAAGVGAPHIRQRLFFGARRVADTRSERRNGVEILLHPREGRRSEEVLETAWTGSGGPRMGNSDSNAGGRDTRAASGEEAQSQKRYFDEGVRYGPRSSGEDDRVGDPDCEGPEGRSGERRDDGTERATLERASGEPDWSACDWVWCRDGVYRPVEPGTFPLADGAPSRVGRLRAYGNAIVPQVAATFIRAFLTQ